MSIGRCEVCGAKVIRLASSERKLDKVMSGPEHGMCGDPACMLAVATIVS